MRPWVQKIWLKIASRSLPSRVALAAALVAVPATIPAAWGAPDQEQAVLAAVHTLIDAWREPSVAKAESVLHEDYRAQSWQVSEKGRFVFLETRDHLLGQISGLRPDEWDVRLMHTTVNIDPNGLGVVWAKYVFYSAGKPNHCGYESYTLLRTAKGWKIINFADTDTPLRGRTVEAVCPV